MKFRIVMVKNMVFVNDTFDSLIYLWTSKYREKNIALRTRFFSS